MFHICLNVSLCNFKMALSFLKKQFIKHSALSLLTKLNAHSFQKVKSPLVENKCTQWREQNSFCTKCTVKSF